MEVAPQKQQWLKNRILNSLSFGSAHKWKGLHQRLHRRNFLNFATSKSGSAPFSGIILRSVSDAFSFATYFRRTLPRLLASALFCCCPCIRPTSTFSVLRVLSSLSYRVGKFFRKDERNPDDRSELSLSARVGF